MYMYTDIAKLKWQWVENIARRQRRHLWAEMMMYIHYGYDKICLDDRDKKAYGKRIVLPPVSNYNSLMIFS